MGGYNCKMEKAPALSGKCQEAGQEFVKFSTPEGGGDVQSPKEFYIHTHTHIHILEDF